MRPHLRVELDRGARPAGPPPRRRRGPGRARARGRGRATTSRIAIGSIQMCGSSAPRPRREASDSEAVRTVTWSPAVKNGTPSSRAWSSASCMPSSRSSPFSTTRSAFGDRLHVPRRGLELVRVGPVGHHDRDPRGVPDHVLDQRAEHGRGHDHVRAPVGGVVRPARDGRADEGGAGERHEGQAAQQTPRRACRSLRVMMGMTIRNVGSRPGHSHRRVSWRRARRHPREHPGPVGARSRARARSTSASTRSACSPAWWSRPGSP